MLDTAVYGVGDLVLEPRSKKAIRLKHEERGAGEILALSIPAAHMFVCKEAILNWDTMWSYGTPFQAAVKKRKEDPYSELPEVEGVSMHSPMLTDKVRHLLHTFWAIVASKALQASFPIRKATIGTFRDPAENRQQVVLRLLTEVTATQAMAFWESLESDIQEWLSEQSESDRLTFLRYISMRIHWK